MPDADRAALIARVLQKLTATSQPSKSRSTVTK